MDPFPRTIGELIAGWRERRGWSQTRLCEALGLRQSTLSSWERGVNDVSREVFDAIAKVLDIPQADRDLAWGLPVKAPEVSSTPQDAAPSKADEPDAVGA